MQAANVHDGTGGDGVFNTPNKVVDNFKWTKKSKAFFFPLFFRLRGPLWDCISTKIGERKCLGSLVSYLHSVSINVN